MESAYQCPNCGGYKSWPYKHGFESNGKWLFLILGLIVFYITIPVLILIYIKFKSDHRVCDQCLFGHKCQLCGYQWLQRPGEVLPIVDNPTARAFGQANLEEQERARQAAAAAYWYNQKH
jgi:hypothetical protein